MVGWHHRLKGHEFEQSLGDSDGQRSLAYYSPCSRKESDTTEQLNNKNNNTCQFLQDVSPKLHLLGPGVASYISQANQSSSVEFCSNCTQDSQNFSVGESQMMSFVNYW